MCMTYEYSLDRKVVDSARILELFAEFHPCIEQQFSINFYTNSSYFGGAAVKFEMHSYHFFERSNCYFDLFIRWLPSCNLLQQKSGRNQKLNERVMEVSSPKMQEFIGECCNHRNKEDTHTKLHDPGWMGDHGKEDNRYNKNNDKKG